MIPYSKRVLTTSEQLYRLFLLLYPAQFRRTCQQEMLQTFRACCREALQRAGLPGLLRFWSFILYDLSVTAFVEHIHCIRAFLRQLLNREKEYAMLNHPFQLEIAQQTDIGRKRANNEDNMLSVVPQDTAVRTTKGALFVVADGMGGHDRGELASKLTVEEVNTAYYQSLEDDITVALTQAVKRANFRVYQGAQSIGLQQGKIGSTCIAAVVRGNTAYIANVGDSRAYIVRGGQIRQISRDHSWVAEQVLAGILTPEQARTHPRSNVITRSIGTEPDVTVDTFVEEVQNGDILILCTDGLSSLISDQEIKAIVEPYDSHASVEQLIKLANERGGPDNITAIVTKVSKGEVLAA
ncbi:Stp1/IreP family PP2C-type Ser/Thr phosphatase [Ktedonosporobacter rubrisoli]|uniref:Stp1/IreP family PP2C-type Ser/Thr phosphatase n=1 Tax=Ktedonosporobacter rubrisoli TaxID=2509675 RepID=A0A4P6JWJ2_KTERU|nr:Stp1/IreP family PP2C-type Ser/Thr phosphatase [Ktedonosporobacter rubrisoli]QBD79783.1 Stp1/IreP family PP2C-type Ser/Thr phosphatase [Ktedonosporobacter rubrisoli]